jgi:hypothetical protein
MKKIIKHYPMTDRLIVRRGYMMTVFVVLIPCYLNELIILEQMFGNQKVYTGQ